MGGLRSEARIKCTMGVCSQACGKVASIASGRPLRPSTQAISTSATARRRGSLSTASQNLAPSVSCHQMPRTARSRSPVTPKAS
jgi:hypothetical protein